MSPRIRLSRRDLDKLAATPPGDAPVLDEVWRTALELADRDMRRIAILSPTEVVVINEPGEVPRWLLRQPPRPARRSTPASGDGKPSRARRTAGKPKARQRRT